jgi:hypothetical protein
VYINKYRECTLASRNWITSRRLTSYNIICESKSFNDFNEEKEDLPNSIKFSFKSEKEEELGIFKIFAISVYRFTNGCGIPDTPLHARYEMKENTVIYYSMDEERYKIIGNNTIKCLYDGNWDKEIPLIEPIVQCSTEELGLRSGNFKEVEFENFEFFNDREIAVIGSTIKYQCQKSNSNSNINYENSSQIFVSICDENGLWIGDHNKCYDRSNYRNL